MPEYSFEYTQSFGEEEINSLIEMIQKSPGLLVLSLDVLIDTNFEDIVAMYSLLSLSFKTLMVNVDISPHYIDSESGIFSFSAQVHTTIFAENVSALLSLEIIDLRINKCTFTDEAFVLLCHLIKTSNSLTYLDLSYCRLSHVNFNELQYNSKLTNVNLSNISIGLNGLLTVFDLVSTGQLPPNVQVSPNAFDLSFATICYESKVDTADLSALLNAVKSNIPIKCVKCHGLKTVSLEGLITLLEILSIHQSVIDLEVSPHCIDVENGTVCFLRQKFTQISAQELQSLHCLLQSCSLQKLTFKKCQISDVGMSVLCDVIRTCPSLTSVDFTHCRLFHSNILEIINAIQSNPTLKKVDLRLRTCPSLTSVDFTHCRLFHSNILEIINAIQSNPTLKKVDQISHNDIELNTLLAILKQFSTHESPPFIEVLPHSIDFSRGIISYADKIKNIDLRVLLHVLISKVPVNLVECLGMLDLDLDSIVTLFRILSINNSLVDVDVSPHLIDPASGIFLFSPHDDTKTNVSHQELVKLTVNEVSLLKSLLQNFCIKELSMIKCDFSNVITPLCDLIQANQSLTSVDFGHCQLTDKHVLEIVSALQSKSCLKMINLTNMNIAFKTLLDIFKQFSTHQSPPIIEVHPHSIDFSLGNISCVGTISNIDVDLLVDALNANIPIKRVSFTGSGNDLSFIGLLNLFTILFKYKEMIVFDNISNFVNTSTDLIHWRDYVSNHDLISILSVLNWKVSLKRVECFGLIDPSFEGIVALYQILSINNSLIDVDISPHVIDTESGIFSYSPQVHTEVTAKHISALLSLEIIDLRINKCTF
ncbi:hypothetical protein GEMRC1_009809 [Eukaryota sp. GEM-RC1]